MEHTSNTCLDFRWFTISTVLHITSIPFPPGCHTPWQPQELEKLRPMAAATAEVEQRATSAEERLVGCGMYHQLMARNKNGKVGGFDTWVLIIFKLWPEKNLQKKNLQNWWYLTIQKELARTWKNGKVGFWPAELVLLFPGIYITIRLVKVVVLMEISSYDGDIMGTQWIRTNYMIFILHGYVENVDYVPQTENLRYHDKDVMGYTTWWHICLTELLYMEHDGQVVL